jgi:hypothetical protein
MILVLADTFDQPAQRLVARWAAHDARLMTPRDLSRPGWRLHPGAPSRWSAAVSDTILQDTDPLLGVVCCLHAVNPATLGWIVAADRDYVATEMTAFLASWLTELRCVVVNRPTPTCLCGPGWRPAAWASAASALGIPVSRARATARRGGPWRARRVMTIAGRRCLGTGGELIAARAGQLAERAGLRLAQFAFGDDADGSPLLDASPTADLDDEAVADGLLDLLRETLPC